MGEFAVSTRLFRTESEELAFEKCVEANFAAVELMCQDTPCGRWWRSPAGTSAALNRMNIRATSVHSPREAWHLAATEESARIDAMETALACFAAAVTVGADVVVLHPNQPEHARPFTKENHASCLERACEIMAILAQRAAEQGLRLAVENMDAHGRPRAGRTVADLLKLIDGLGEHVGILLDVGHANANGLDPTDELRVAGDKLFAVHIHDNHSFGRDEHTLPGLGTTDWDTFLPALARCPADVRRVFEVSTGKPTTDGLLKALAQLQDKWANQYDL